MLAVMDEEGFILRVIEEGPALGGLCNTSVESAVKLPSSCGLLLAGIKDPDVEGLGKIGTNR